MANGKPAKGLEGFHVVAMKQRTIAALRAYKDDDGAWHFIVDDVEVSGPEFVRRGGGLLLHDIDALGLR